jgi:HlyD family secretion protein
MLNRYSTSKWLLVALALAVGALLWRPLPMQFLVPGLFKSSTAADYVTVPVLRQDIVPTVTAGGTLKPVTEVKVGTQVSGQIKELYTDFNSSVRNGEVIARIDPDMFEAKVAQARAELEMAQALISVRRAEIARYSAERDNTGWALAVATAQAQRAAIALDEANRQLARTRPLAEKAIASATSLEQAENAKASAEAQLTAARAEEQSKAASSRAANASIEMTQAQLANDLAQVKQKEALLRQAKLDLDHTYIRAPVTGTVVERSVDRGQTVAASLSAPTLFTIAQDLTQMQVEASVVEADVQHFVAGQAVKFMVDAYPRRQFEGKVLQIRKAAHLEHNVVTYTVIIAASNRDQVLMPGMTANLKVITATRPNAIVVLNAALRFRPSKGRDADVEHGRLIGEAHAASHDAEPSDVGTVFVLDAAGKPSAVRLHLGITDGHLTEVLAGELPVGAHVITAATASSVTDAETSLTKFRLQ